MTKEEIINDTISYYSEDPSRRAIDASICVYQTKDNKHCAFGRYMKEDFLDHPICNVEIATIEELLEEFELDSVDDLLVEKVHGHDQGFWVMLQDLHDSKVNWSNDSHTSDLIDAVKQLISIYDLNEEQIDVL